MNKIYYAKFGRFDNGVQEEPSEILEFNIIARNGVEASNKISLEFENIEFAGQLEPLEFHIVNDVKLLQ